MKRVSVTSVFPSLLMCAICATVISSQRWPHRQQETFKMRIQPELDVINVEEYLRTDRLFRYQLKCVLFDGYCDIVGRWFVPRMPQLLLGECPMCTPAQAVKLPSILNYVKTEKREIYDLLYDKYVLKDKWEKDGNTTTEKTVNGTI